MTDNTTPRTETQPVDFAALESLIRVEIARFLQQLLEAEVTEQLGRAKSARRQAVDAEPGYRNGYGKPRQFTVAGGTVTVRRPRVRGLEERFQSRLLPLFARRSPEVADALPTLYLHGLAEGDFDLALRGLLGEDAPLSASTIARLKTQWQADWQVWNTRRLDTLEVVYLWADGIYVKAGVSDEKAAVLVLIGALTDGRKVLLAVQAGYRESTESWASLLRDLQARGLRAPALVIADGALGLWAALRGIYPEAAEQRCWNHRMLNLLDRIPRTHQRVAKGLLRTIVYAPTRATAEEAKAAYQRWCRKRGYEDAARLIDDDWERMVAFYRFPSAHWDHLRTTNPVESPFAALRLRTNAAKRYKRVDRAMAVIWKMLLTLESRFRRLNGYELLPAVYAGVRYIDGTFIEKQSEETAA